MAKMKWIEIEKTRPPLLDSEIKNIKEMLIFGVSPPELLSDDPYFQNMYTVPKKSNLNLWHSFLEELDNGKNK